MPAADAGEGEAEFDASPYASCVRRAIPVRTAAVSSTGGATDALAVTCTLVDAAASGTGSCVAGADMTTRSRGPRC